MAVVTDVEPGVVVDRTPAVSGVGLTRQYGEGESAVHALRGATLEIPRGQFAAVMGPSGSGKSTLMHILAGLDEPTEGQAWIGGEEITGMDDDELTLLRRRQLGFIFQFFNLLPMLTAEDNITLPMSIAGETPAAEWLDAVIAKVGLQDRRHHKPAELSGGQQQRVAIARALLSDPAMILADEPTGNLDSRSSAEILAIFQRLNETGKTVVMVTHEPDVAAHCKRIVRMRDGIVARDELVPHPRRAEDEIAAGIGAAE